MLAKKIDKASLNEVAASGADRQACIAAIVALGFPEPVEVSGLRSIAHLFGTTKSRCGIYLLVLPENRLYVGQAVDVVRRFAQHSLAHEEILAFAFLATPKKHLDARERDLIYRAEAALLTLTNIVHVSDVTGESDLDTVVPPDMQDRWLEDPFQQNELDLSNEPIHFPRGQLARYAESIRRLQGHPLGRAALIQLFLFIESAIPYPRLTEYSFWSVSCMPSTNASTWPRLLCVSQSVMEVFCLGFYKDQKFAGATWGFMNVASDVLFDAFGGESAFSAAHPNVDVRHSRYRDAGQHQVNLQAYIQNDMLSLLADPRVTKAAATLSLRLMRRRATIYFKFHCPQLVDEALRFREDSEEEFTAALRSVLLPEEADPPATASGSEVA